MHVGTGSDRPPAPPPAILFAIVIVILFAEIVSKFAR